MYRRTCYAMALCCILAAASFAEVNWPCFRGTSCGVVEDEVLPVSWNTTENVVWKVDVIGRAWSCPVVWGDKVFLTTVVSEGHVEEARKGLYFHGERNKPPSAVHHWGHIESGYKRMDIETRKQYFFVQQYYEWRALTLLCYQRLLSFSV